MQLTEATQAGTEVVRAASRYGSETFLAVIVVSAVVVVVVLWVWKVVIPNSVTKMEIEKESAKSSRENTAQLSHAVSSCLPVITSTHERVLLTGKLVGNTDSQIHKMAAVLKVGVIAIEKIAKDSKIDISQELSRIHGILDDA